MAGAVALILLASLYAQPREIPVNPSPGGIKPREIPTPPSPTGRQPREVNACCSCLISMRLVLKRGGPIDIPPGKSRVEDPDAPGGGPVDPATTTQNVAGHEFDVAVRFRTYKSAEQGNLTLKFLERTDRLPPFIQLTKKARVNEWYDAFELLLTSQEKVRKDDGRPPQPGDAESKLETIASYTTKGQGTATHWLRQYEKEKSLRCPVNPEKVLINDTPKSRAPRTMAFHIIVESPPHCDCEAPKKLEVKATQVLRAKPLGNITDQRASGFYGPKGLLKAGNAVEGEETAPDPIVRTPLQTPF